MNSWLHTPLASSQPSQTGSQVFCPKLQEPNLVVKVEDWWFWITYYVGNGARTQSSGWGNSVCCPWFHPLGSAKKLRGWGLGESHFKWLVKWALSLCLFAPSYSTAWMINPTFTKGLTTNTSINYRMPSIFHIILHLTWHFCYLLLENAEVIQIHVFLVHQYTLISS